MQTEHNEKIIVKYPPCKLPEACLDYDYDPCESSDDITEKDLAVLLKEEEAKIQEATDRAEAERFKKEQELLNDRKDLNESEKPVKKKCKKVIKNPFFSNRLELSTCLPPPPPTPPPQFFPTFDENKCKGRLSGSKRKKKCKKTKIDENDELIVEEDANKKCECEVGSTGAYIDSNATETEEPPHELDDRDKGRRKCRKISNRLPCRKKSIEISSGFPTRQIPARQNDLPPTSPLEMPEVERQIWLSCKNDCQTDCIRNNCKMTCNKRKCKGKIQSRASISND